MNSTTLRWLMVMASAAAGSLYTVWTASERSAGRLAAQVRTDAVADNARLLLEEGRRVFRYETFGDEAFWGDTLKLHQAIAGAKLGGVGPGVSGRAHRVLTGICLITPDDRQRVKIIDTRVRFKRLSKAEIEAYIASREWRDKAGGYAIQGLAGSFVQKIIGSYTNVVGLPLTEVTGLLSGEGFPVYFNWVKAADVDPD